ncbi:hypothetical protein O181_012394 [Austropuccinia psidii MF-1]|uniref:Uncharacterized protein n=1 Tax=Austropuccinia psidii MF-1 TaxID=1389203 RepID=A0A9Q3BUK8_9BASI|nr:hypothetical protein [Austropuccinia psidii MF-1]
MRPRGRNSSPQCQVDPLEHILAKNPRDSKWPKKTQNLELAQGPKAPKLDQGPRIPTMASGKHQRTPSTSNKGASPQYWGNPGPTQWTQGCRNQEWCIYAIIYNYASFFLRNLILMFSRFYYAIFQQVPQANHPFKRKASPPQSYTPLQLPEDHSRTPDHWLSRCWYFTSGFYKVLFQGVVKH